MGVPKFYRWISERYPKINQVITDTALLPEFDHLYLDMNGILHGCSHPSDKDVSEKISEKDMIFAIMNYMDRIISQIVKPKVSVFMAIDGVAPRAKLNQQRSRRFRSAKDLLESANSNKDNNDNLLLQSNTSSEQNAYGGAFDSNCITPGTEFMARISEAIKYFIRKKIKEDPFWRSLQIVFSGHEVPGEGEHKIMDFIRDMKSSPNYQPNTRHVMYGQDADLIMLGLVTHEPHFTLLREIIDFNFSPSSNQNSLKAVKKFTKQSEFQLLHLSILREYLGYEFAADEGYDLERIIDDFVFLTFLVGNDFLPHLPSLDIADGAFDLLFDTYRKQRLTWGSNEYLVNTGAISDPQRLENFLQEIGSTEHMLLEKREEQEAEYRKKKRNWDKRDSKASSLPSEAELLKEEETKQAEYLTMLSKISSTSSSSDLAASNGEGNKKDFKGRYYFEKLGFTPANVEEHLALQKAYIEGLVWCLAYYYKGCISWGWFFPFHYGPMLSDLKNLPHVFENMKFDLGNPLKPFQQLMGCLPPASSALVPPPYRKLMTSPISPICHFYPTDFKIDMEGKKNSWEGVNLLEFIDVQLLKDTIDHHCPDTMLTADERSRNTFGNVFIFTYDGTVMDTIPSFNREIGFPDISGCQSRVTVLEGQKSQLHIPFEPKLVPGTIIPAPGYPSLKVLPIKSVDRIPIGLNCFGMVSKYPNFVLNLYEMPPELPPAEQLASKVLGKNLFINYPMMHEAKVVGLSDVNCEVRLHNKSKKMVVKRYSEKESSEWLSESSTLQEQYMRGAGIPGTGGLGIGEIRIRLFLKPLQGMKISPADGSSKKVFGNEEADIPLQTALWKSPAPDPRFVERGPKKLKDLYPPGCRVLLTKGKHKGCVGSVLDVAVDTDDEDSNAKKVITKVRILPPEPPFGLAIARSVTESYLSSSEAANVLKLRPQILGKIMGSLLVEPGRYDLGLNLRYKKEFCVIGYTRYVQKKSIEKKKATNAWTPGDSVRVFGSQLTSENDNEENDDGYWEYTPKAVRLLAVYRLKYPQLFLALSKYPNEKKYDAIQLFGPNGKEMLPKVRDWLNSLETAALPRAPTTTNAMPLAAIAAVQRAADVRAAFLEQSNPLKEVILKLPPSALFREGSRSATDVVQTTEFTSEPQLGDRIVNLCANGLPFAARGTVVSVHSSTHGCVEVVMDEEFIGGSNLQGSCMNFRGKLCLWTHLLKVSAADSVDDLKEYSTSADGKKTVETVVHSPVPSAVNNNNNPTQSVPSKNVKTDRSKTPTDCGKKKQGAWKEAKGPQAGVKGFKGLKTNGGKNGYASWKNHICKDTKLPVTSNIKAVSNNQPNYKIPDEQQKNLANAAADLKAVLGVTSGEPSVERDTSAATPLSAADALLALMIGEKTAPGNKIAPVVQAPLQQTPKFNFTYTQEGSAAASKDVSMQQLPYPTTMQDPKINNRAAINQPIAGVPYQMMHPTAHYPTHPVGFIGYPPPQQIPMYHHPTTLGKSAVVPRTKKKGGENGNTIIPSAVVSKAKK